MKIIVDVGEPLGFVLDVVEAKPVIRIPSRPEFNLYAGSSTNLFVEIPTDEHVEIERIGMIINGKNDKMPLYRVKDLK